MTTLHISQFVTELFSLSAQQPPAFLYFLWLPKVEKGTLAFLLQEEVLNGNQCLTQGNEQLWQGSLQSLQRLWRLCVSFRPQELSSAENQCKACRNNRQAQHRNEVGEEFAGVQRCLNLEHALWALQTLAPSVATLGISRIHTNVFLERLAELPGIWAETIVTQDRPRWKFKHETVGLNILKPAL